MVAVTGCGAGWAAGFGASTILGCTFASGTLHAEIAITVGIAISLKIFILLSWPNITGFASKLIIMTDKKIRIDQALVERGMAESRSKAQAYIMAGLVSSGAKKITKSGQIIAFDADIHLKGKDHPWVSRGGIKLDHAIKYYAINVAGLTAIDVGSSTGGFTDVLLQSGAAKIFAVDSGTNQLAWKLRQDERVIVHEQTSARILTADHINAPVDLIVCDASFIGLSKVLERPMQFAKDDAQLIALIKPQFEAGKAEVGKGGVVRDETIHKRVCDNVCLWLEEQNWKVQGLTQSPITGPQGNVEFLVWAQNMAHQE